MRMRYFIVAAIAVMMTACEIYDGDKRQPSRTGEVITDVIYKDLDDKRCIVNDVLLLDAYINEPDEAEREKIIERMTSVDAIIADEVRENIYILRDYGSYHNSPDNYYHDMIVDTKGTSISESNGEWSATKGGTLHYMPLTMTLANNDGTITISINEKSSNTADAEVISEAELTITDGVINGSTYLKEPRIEFNTVLNDVCYDEGYTSGELDIECDDSYYNTHDEVRAELYIKADYQMARIYYLDYTTERKLSRIK